MSRSAGKWFVCFQIALPDQEGQPRDGAAVGIDVGLSSLIATSDGETVATPHCTKRAAKKQRRLQRAFARHSGDTANQRRDVFHKLSRSLEERYALIALEDLDVARLSRSRLAKAVHNTAWGHLHRFLEYQAASAGTRVKTVDPRGQAKPVRNAEPVSPRRSPSAHTHAHVAV